MNTIKYSDLENYFKKASDVNLCEFMVEKSKISLIYAEGLSNIDQFNSEYLPLINPSILSNLDAIFPGIFKTRQVEQLSDISDTIFDGKLIFMINYNQCYEIILPSKPTRTPSTSNIDPLNLYSSNDGFIEDARTNVALVRKRLKTMNLIVERIEIGKTNKSTLYLMYLKEYSKYRDQIIKKLNLLNNKLTISITSLGRVFQDKSLMPMTLNTGSPENFAMALAQGRTGIILDNCPVAILIPVTFSCFSTMKNDEDSPAFFSIGIRVFIVFFLTISLFGLGLMISIINYHPGSINISIISNLKLTERGTSLPIFLEVIAILILFEFYRFASSRSSPTYVQNIVIILGGLFIGQNAINSGLIGPLVLLITSMCYLSSYAFTNNPQMISAISNIRFIILVASFMFGMYGFLCASFVIIGYLSTLKSFDVPYLFPFSPFSTKVFKSFFVPRSRR